MQPALSQVARTLDFAAAPHFSQNMQQRQAYSQDHALSEPAPSTPPAAASPPVAAPYHYPVSTMPPSTPSALNGIEGLTPGSSAGVAMGGAAGASMANSSSKGDNQAELLTKYKKAKRLLKVGCLHICFFLNGLTV